ncbi:hypothetical protein PM082_023590 [Marasmius tenuissimus]|nr:hypothetical protein PM082_023590 [Marasmius tenuissimus]
MAEYFTLAAVLTYPFVTALVIFFIYGVYTMLFVQAICILTRRPTSEAQSSYRGNGPAKLYTWLTTVLFLSATTYTISLSWYTYRQATLLFIGVRDREYERSLDALGSDRESSVVSTIYNVSVTLMNTVAECMLIHRCYTIWGRNKLILSTFALASLVINGIDLITMIILSVTVTNINDPANFKVFLKAYTINHGNVIAIVVFNLVVTFMTGGRIWWITRQARQSLGKPIQRYYKTIVVVIIESGILYAGTLLISVTIDLSSDPNTKYPPFELAVIPTLLSGLAPTLVIVRAAHGKTVDSVEQMVSVSTIRFHVTEFAREAGEGETVELSSMARNLAPVADRKDTDKVA